MNNTNDKSNDTTTRYCTCYVKRPVSRHIHVCRKCNRKIYQQDVLNVKEFAIVIALMTICYFIIAWLQANGATP